MTDIIESGTFDPVPLIEVGDPVEGGAGGASNKQGVVLANRTLYLKQAVEELTENVDSLNPADIGAEVKGAAATAVSQHVLAPDPHPVYLLKTDATQQFVTLTGANLPNGAVLLNAQGKIPSALLDIVQSSYIVVANKAARLALTKSSSLIIAVQSDEDRLYYLNGNLEPATESNWIQGQSATVSGVSRVFNRTGVITAQAGDYNADQITETPARTFLTPAERATFNAKQNKLVSGTDVKTINGASVLGEGDFPITPAGIGASALGHKHVAAEVTDFVAASKDTTGSMVKAGAGISVAYDNVKKILTIAGTKNEDGTSTFNSYTALGMSANQIQSFNFASQSKYNMIAAALKKEAGASGISFLADSFTSATVGNYKATPGVGFNDPLTILKGGITNTVKDGTLYSATLSNQYASVTADTITTESIVPVLSSLTSAPGYVPTASDYYSVGADQRPAWYAFNDDPTTGYISKNGATSGAPVFVQIQLPAVTKIYAYQFSNRTNTTFNNNPMTWTFQGSNDGTTWNILDTRNEAAGIAVTPGIDRKFTLSAVAEYRYYKINITAAPASQSVLLTRFKIFGFGGENVILRSVANNKNYTITNNALTEVTETLTPTVITSRGVNHIALTPAMLTTLGDNFKLMSGVTTGLQSTLTPLSQLVMSITPKAMGSYGAISKATLVATLAGAGKVAVAFSRNMTDWYVYSSGWVKIATPTNTAASADALLANGMNVAGVAAITQAQWAEFFGGVDVPLDGLAVAYALSAPAPADSATIKSLTLTVSETDSWKIQTAAEVEVRWRATAVSFKPITAGDYKFIYQAP